MKEFIETSDAVVVGAGAGLSTAAGHEYGGKRFRDHFSDFEKIFGFHDMYSGGFYPFPDKETFWAYWSRMIWLNRYDCEPGATYESLFRLLKDKNYFVITTNVDHCFQKSGFDKERLFYTQGDYGLFQCSKPCCQVTFDNFEAVKVMFEQQNNMRIPSNLVPICSNCGRELTTNLRCDNRFVEDLGWHKAQVRYKKFLKDSENKRVLFLELGVGFNTPGIIKYPFWKMVKENENANFVTVDINRVFIPHEIKDRSIRIKADINDVLSEALSS